MVGASWSCIASGVSRPPRHNDHFEAILERNYLRPMNIVRKTPRFNKNKSQTLFSIRFSLFLDQNNQRGRFAAQQPGGALLRKAAKLPYQLA